MRLRSPSLTKAKGIEISQALKPASSRRLTQAVSDLTKVAKDYF